MVDTLQVGIERIVYPVEPINGILAEVSYLLLDLRDLARE
jgi:hypothetical protein